MVLSAKEQEGGGDFLWLRVNFSTIHVLATFGVKLVALSKHKTKYFARNLTHSCSNRRIKYVLYAKFSLLRL